MSIRLPGLAGDTDEKDMMAPAKARIFKETFDTYLGMIDPEDFESKAGILGCSVRHNRLTIPFYTTDYTVSSRDVIDSRGGTADFAVSVVLLKYILMCPSSLPGDPDDWVSFRDFKDAGPLVSYFTSNTSKTIEAAFSGKPDLLCQALESLGGVPAPFSSHYDLSMQVHALPRIPVILNFNDRDEEFPAACSMLFKRDAQRWLDMECVAITATFLAGKLLGFLSRPDA